MFDIEAMMGVMKGFLLLQSINLVMFDIEAMMGVLKGVEMELIDCAFPLLTG